MLLDFDFFMAELYEKCEIIRKVDEIFNLSRY